MSSGAESPSQSRVFSPPTYRPHLREVATRMHIDHYGWITGTLHVAPQHSVMYHLNRFADRAKKADEGGQYVKVTQARFPGQSQAVPFLALRRESISLVLPTDTNDKFMQRDPGSTVPHAVTFMLADLYVHGTIVIPPNLRVSDFLQSNRGFLAVTDATLILPTQERAGQQAAPAVLVSQTHAVAVASN